MAKSNKTKSSKSKKDETEKGKVNNRNGKVGRDTKSDGESNSGNDGAVLLSKKAKVPVAATGAVLIGAAGAATVRKIREPRTRRGRLLTKAARPTALVAATGGARRIKKLVIRA